MKAVCNDKILIIPFLKKCVRGEFCQTGYTGILCQGCSKFPEKMFYKWGKECLECENKTNVLARNIISSALILILHLLFGK